MMVTWLAATLSGSVKGFQNPGQIRLTLATRVEPSQRKLSLSSRDDLNYRDIMRLRAQQADTL